MKWALSRKNLWERIPAPLKSFGGRLLGILPPPLVLGGRFRRTLCELGQSQFWPVEKIREYQVDQLRRLCTLAANQTAYYRETFRATGFDPRSLKNPEDLAGLPTIDRDTLEHHLDEMSAVSPRSVRVDKISTGGTSGKPLFFYIGGGRSSVEFAYLTACWARIGYRPGSPLAVFRGQIVAADRSRLRHEYDPILRRHFYSNFHMTEENMMRYLEHVASIGPCFLHVYPSACDALCRCIRRNSLTAPSNVLGIIAESEIVYPEQRKLAEEVFGCRYFSCYGHTEKLVLAAECEHTTNYHVWPTYGYFELLDPQGRPVDTPGRRGEIVGTGFINHVVPFIRYRTGDHATYMGDSCAMCGRPHPLITDIRGHNIQEMLIADDGTEITWTAMNMHDDTFLHVRQFQFYQDTPGRSVLRIVPGTGWSDADPAHILNSLNRKMEGRISVTIRVVDEIPLSVRGKAIFVDQRIERKSDEK